MAKFLVYIWISETTSGLCFALNKQQQNTPEFCMHAVNETHWNAQIHATHK